MPTLLQHFLLPSVLLAGAILLLLIGARRLRRALHAGDGSGGTGAGAGLSAPLPLPALEQMLTRLKGQEEELTRLRGELRRREQDSLRLSRELLGHLPSGVLFFDPQGVVIEANPAARTALGFASPRGLRATELFRGAAVREADGRPLGEAAALLAQSIARGEPLQRKEMDYVTPEGERRTLGLTFSPLQNRLDSAAAAGAGPGAGPDEAAVGGLICLLTDLTGIRALEQELRLRQNLAALGEMAAGIAHEFKNSLATISGYAQLLARELGPAPASGDAAGGEALGYTEKILGQIGEMTRLSSEFLLFARPLEARGEPISLTESLVAAIAALPAAEFPGIRVELAGEAPPILGDGALLSRVWANLLRNACESMAAAGVAGEVRVELDADTAVGRARVRVRDAGPGVAAELAERIFIPFFTTKPAGTGLGLALVHKIVAAHRGAVILEEGAPGRVCFAVSLPLAAGESQAAAARA